MRGDEVRALTLDDDRDDARETTMRWCSDARARVARQGETRARARRRLGRRLGRRRAVVVYFLFMYACTFRTIGRIARAGPQIFARGAIFILGPKSSNVSTVVPTIATSTRVSLLPVRLAPPNPPEPKDAKSTPVHRRERVER